MGLETASIVSAFESCAGWLSKAFEEYLLLRENLSLARGIKFKKIYRTLHSRVQTMVDVAMEARRRFLEASAHHYASSAPSTSAHLMQQLEPAASPSNLLKHGLEFPAVCKACGTIMISGWTSRTTITSKDMSSSKNAKAKTRTQLRRKASISRGKHVRTDCLICYRFEEKPLQKAKRGGSGPQKTSTPPAALLAPLAQADPSAISQESPKPIATNASSKRRAKARKQGGLQAMLEKSKASATSLPGPGLNLLDLMQQD